jgi:hypothetical protein
LFKKWSLFRKQVPYPNNFESAYSDVLTPKDLEKFNEWIPQSLQFTIDILPYVRRLIKNWSNDKILNVLDVGAGHASGTHLLSVLFRSNFFGVKMKVDALEIVDTYKKFSEQCYPEINYIVKDIFDMKSTNKWNLIICSHTIEHLEDPIPFIKKLCDLSTDWVLLYAPFNETGVRPENHISTITQEMVDLLNPVFSEIFVSPGWDRREGDRQCILFVLKGRNNSTKFS